MSTFEAFVNNKDWKKKLREVLPQGKMLEEIDDALTIIKHKKKCIPDDFLEEELELIESVKSTLKSAKSRYPKLDLDYIPSHSRCVESYVELIQSQLSHSEVTSEQAETMIETLLVLTSCCFTRQITETISNMVKGG